MTSAAKKVLIITYYFPPSGGSGVQRTLKFVKYLRQFGWEPVVLTARNADYPAYDESLWQDVPENLKIYRSKIPEPYRLYRKFTGKKPNTATDVEVQSVEKSDKQTRSERISQWIRAAFFIPDARIFWLFFALPLAVKIVRREKIAVIFSSAPPYTTHLIGGFLKRFTRQPWVADFRDSWIGWHSAPKWRPVCSRKTEIKMEEYVLHHADKILAVSSGVKNDLISRHRRFDDRRWHILPNGYDEDDFRGVTPLPKDDKITITYTGTFFGNFSPEYLIKAVEALRTENVTAVNKFRLRFVGRIATDILEKIENSPVRDLIELIPYRPHKTGLAYLLGTDYSFLVIDDTPINRGILTGKLFEYIGSGRPILALIPEGDAAEIIRINNLGIVAPPDDVSQIKEALRQILSGKAAEETKSAAAEAVKRQFTRKTLTEKLAGIFAEICNRPQD